MAHHPSPATRRRRTLVPCALVLLLAACGASGGEATGPSSTAASEQATSTSTSAPASTTTAAQLDGELGRPDDTTTTEAADGPDDEAGAVDLEALEGILPEAEVAGEGFHSESDVEEGYDEPDDLDLALEDRCPEAVDLLDDVVAEGRVGRAFQGEGDRVLRVVLDPTPDAAWDADRLDRTIAAAQGCGSFQLDQDGLSITTDLAIERNDTYGDRGVAANLVVTVESPDLPGPVVVTIGMRAWVRGSVLVVTSSTDGIDDDTYETIPADHEKVEVVSAALEEQLASLAD